MSSSLSFVVVGLVVGVLLQVSQGDGLARRPGHLDDRFFKKKEKAERGPGILTDRVERRNKVREARREKALAAAEASSKKDSSVADDQEVKTASAAAGESRSTSVAESTSKEKALRGAQGSSRSSARGDGPTIREKRRGAGRAGKGTGPSKRRRVVLKPLFGN